MTILGVASVVLKFSAAIYGTRTSRLYGLYTEEPQFGPFSLWWILVCFRSCGTFGGSGPGGASASVSS